MATEKRKVRGYKMADTPYKKALKKQKNPPLATFIEKVVTVIADGGSVELKPKSNN